MRAPYTVSFHPGPELLRFHPTFTSTLLVASTHGDFQMRDLTSDMIDSVGTVSSPEGHPNHALSAVDISSSGDRTLTFLFVRFLLSSCF